MLLLINLIAFLSAFYAIPYIRKYTVENNFYILLSLMVAGMNGSVLTGDIFNLYVFMEIAAVASYALVAFGVEKEELEASFKYQLLGGMASMFILLGIGLLYWTTGTLNIDDISNQLVNYSGNKIVLFIQILFVAGFGLKAAIVPFHAWLPDAHSSAPSPISSMLSGILIKAIGVYVLLRLLFNMFAVSSEIGTAIIVLGLLSMIIGGVLATGQSDYKRLLAYSSISQIGYIMTGVGVGLLILANNGDRSIAALSILGGLYHMVNHAVFKGLLFMNAGAVEHATGIRDINLLGGLSKSMPVTSTTSLFGSMAISGIPPLGGFFSKLIIIIAAVKAHFYLVAFIAALMSIVTLAYFLKFQRKIFSSKPKSDLGDVKEVPFNMKFSMVVLAFISILLGLLIIPEIRDVVLMPAVDVLMGVKN
jgi:multicomponent Na+:H+ antiporter subunit D